MSKNKSPFSYTCDLCGFTTNSSGKYGGHRSTHVRRHELEKGVFHQKRKQQNVTCNICGAVFTSGKERWQHVRLAHDSLNLRRSVGAKKRMLIYRRGYRCEVCACSMWRGQQIPLELDHIDGNPSNNDEINLRLICPNCHAQTPTHAGKNIGRAYYKQRDLSKYPNYRDHEYIKFRHSQ